MDEELLVGGNSTVVHKVGATVRRPAGSWTPRVHELLRTLRAAGIVEVPEPLGLDTSGREVLSYLSGEVGHYPLPDWLWTPEVLRDSAALLRRMHDASIPLVEHRDGWGMPVHEPVQVICHNDFAPYNMIFTDGQLAGVIDFDTSSPGPRSWDLAYLAYRLVPFVADAGPAAPEPSLRNDRARLLIEAYGADHGPTLPDLMEVMALRLEELANFTDIGARETGSSALAAHARMYRDDAARLRSTVPLN